MAVAAASVLEELAQANRAYTAKFGYTFIICATSKSAAEMLAILKQRLNNHAGVEIQVAAEQQRLITQLRLTKLLAE